MEPETKRDLITGLRLPGVFLGCLAIAAALALPSSARADVDTFTVTTSADPGDGTCDATCSLRDALDAADDQEPEQDRVNINLPAFDNTIVLGSHLAYFTQEPLIISGGVFGAVISGNNAHSIFVLLGNPPGSDVVLDGLTLVSAGGAAGGAITSNEVDLTITNSTIANSKSSGVGGILLDSGTLLLEDSTVTGNSTFGSNSHGGGVYVGAGVSAVIRRSTISGNHADNADGGGVYNGGSLSIENSTISGNYTMGPTQGGGIQVGSGTLVLENSTVADNETTGAGGHGGGIAADGMTNVVIARSTISGNHTEGGRGGGIYTRGALTLQSSTVSGNHTLGAEQHGGGIASQSGGPTNLTNSTIAGNETRGASAEGGGVHTEGNASDPALSNTIVADNRVGSLAGWLRDDLGSPDDTFRLAFSLVEGDFFATPTTETVPGSNLIGVDPQLGSLAPNGGFGATHLPGPSSPVVDQGSTITSQDQRLSPRPVDIPHASNSAAAGADGADIGAVELTIAEGPPPAGRAPASNEFSFGRIERNKRRGTAKLAVNVPGAGDLALAGSGVKSASAQADSAGSVDLLIKATGKKRRKLTSTGKVKLTPDVTFTPAGGTANTKTAKLKLRKR